MVDWSDVTLGDVVTLQRGFDLPSRLREPGPYPVVSSAGVTGSHSEFKVAPPGVVIGRYGSLGTVHWMTVPFWPLNTALWVRDFKGNDERFVSYLLKTVTVDGSTASAVPGVNRNHLHKLEVRLPQLSDQRRIADVLAAFDQLIEINARRIKLLEALARSLYREWFVHFRFPGHEDVELVDSELGPIPDGWLVKPVSEVLEVVGGGTPSKKRPEYWDSDIPWFTPSDLTRSRRRFAADPENAITELGLQKSSARLFPASSVLMTSRATLGVLAIASDRATVNQGFIVLPPTSSVPPAFIYEWLASRREALEQIATGATFKEITKGAFKRFPFLEPANSLMVRFGDACGPFLDEIQVLEVTNLRLGGTRDLLLPRLVTGRLDISDIDLGILTPAYLE
jgi:type I restriction enzyme S subunit